jgi:hypothetical protein
MKEILLTIYFLKEEKDIYMILGNKGSILTKSLSMVYIKDKVDHVVF